MSDDKTRNNPDANFKWVEAYTLQGTVFAEMAKEALENNGIPCLLNKTSFLSSAYGIHSTNTPGINAKIMVPEDKLEEGREIIRKMLGVEGD